MNAIRIDRTLLVLGATLVVSVGCSRGTASNNVAANASAATASANSVMAPAKSAAAEAPANPLIAAHRASFDKRFPASLPVTPAEVRALIQRQGGMKAIEELGGRGGPNRYDTVLRGIASGEASWMEVAPLVREGADGHYGEAYSMALSDALTTNPAAALRTGGPDAIESICVDTGIETAMEAQRAFYAAAIASVEKVTEPDLQSLKTQCLAKLREGEGALGQAD